jgi:hypothetical protein
VAYATHSTLKLKGAHPILYISRIKVNATWRFT